MTTIVNMFLRFCFWIMWGTIREGTYYLDGGFISEISYIGRNGRIVGYWAYGYWQPDCPYHGQEYVRVH